MRLLLKKNQLVLILLTLVLMLTIYYIKSPFDKSDEEIQNPDNENTEVTSGRLEELQQLRVVLNEERTETVLGLDSIIADNKSTIAEKNAALEENKYLNNLTEK